MTPRVLAALAALRQLKLLTEQFGCDSRDANRVFTRQMTAWGLDILPHRFLLD